MKRLWPAEELAEHGSLLPDDLVLLANKAGPTRLGFAVLLKFFPYAGRFPSDKHEVPAAVVVLSWPRRPSVHAPCSCRPAFSRSRAYGIAVEDRSASRADALLGQHRPVAVRQRRRRAEQWSGQRMAGSTIVQPEAAEAGPLAARPVEPDSEEAQHGDE